MMFKYKDNNNSIVGIAYVYKRALNNVFKLNNCYEVYFIGNIIKAY